MRRGPVGVSPNVKPVCPGGSSPIVIDPTGQGFHMTDVAHGVAFRKYPSDPSVHLSWTDPHYGNAWLVRPSPDGTVTSLAFNMFGNLSPQPPSDNPNGYSALAFWSKQAGCGIIDHLEAVNCPQVWSQLRLWVDANQDGVAQPKELRKPGAMGVLRISLNYRELRRVDQYGNQFRYVAGIEDAGGPKDKRCYDVFLKER